MIDIVGFMYELWKFFWLHDQFFAILFVGWWWLKQIKKKEILSSVITECYLKLINLSTEWDIQYQFNGSLRGNMVLTGGRVETDIEKDERLKKFDEFALTTEREFQQYLDQLSIFGSPQVKNFIFTCRLTSNANPPRPWITLDMRKKLIYLISIDMGAFSLLEKIKYWLNG